MFIYIYIYYKYVVYTHTCITLYIYIYQFAQGGTACLTLLVLCGLTSLRRRLPNTAS